MAGEEKPYRTYRGGRAKGKVPSATQRPSRRTGDGKGGRGEKQSGARSDYRGPGARPDRQKNVR